MPYIDYVYYKGIYRDTDISEAEFGQYCQLAEDIIDSITRYRIAEMGGLSALPLAVQEIVKKATAAEVSYIELYGMDAIVSGVSDQGFSVGKVSVSGGGNGQTSTRAMISPAVTMYLEQTGLMGRGIATC